MISRISTQAQGRADPNGDLHDHPDYHPACAPAIDAALRRLRADYIALFRPHGFDATTPVEETLGTLDQLVRDGKIRYIGCSNFSIWHLMKSLAVSYARGLERYVAHQAYYSLVGRDYEWDHASRSRSRRLDDRVEPARLGASHRQDSPRRPEAGGEPPEHEVRADAGPQIAEEHLFRVVDALDVVAKETGHAVPQIAIAWVLARTTVASVIVGARTEEQLEQNLASASITLSASHLRALDEASAMPPPYPTWHQLQFVSRNPRPVWTRGMPSNSDEPGN